MFGNRLESTGSVYDKGMSLVQKYKNLQCFDQLISGSLGHDCEES